ncbi:hypothetical protein BDR05DRAFT_978039 [Suillus weaverae]|nr:hypothetical protein BDR05DRAFT_978039 [Suillus weaverae]
MGIGGRGIFVQTGRPLMDSVTLDGNIDRIITVLAHSHATSTCETYGSGLLVFHEQHCPASSVLILAFIAACSGLYSGKIQAWHLLHGQPWLANHDQCTLALGGGKCLAPEAPFTVDILIAIHLTLDLTTPLHTAVYACLTTCFYTIARIGEFTVPSLQMSNWRYDIDCHGFRVAIFHLPRMKTLLTGLSDPQTALSNHMTINHPSSNEALFSWRHRTRMCPLTRGKFVKCLQGASDRLGIESLKAHGVPFENVKTIGHWSMMAPFLQDKPVLEPFMRYALPPPV